MYLYLKRYSKKTNRGGHARRQTSYSIIILDYRTIQALQFPTKWSDAIETFKPTLCICMKV